MRGSQPASRFDEASSDRGAAVSYDDQASRFDERVGLLDDAVTAFTSAIMDEGKAGPGQLVVEIGAGTGRLGAALIVAGVRYIGIDSSGAMLERFRDRLPLGKEPALLIQSDANRAWPVADRAAQVVFGLRSIHHLAPGHASREILRVLRPGGVLLIGRIERGSESLHALMRQRMHELMRAHGFVPRKAGVANAALIDQLAQSGCDVLPARVLATWPLARSPKRLIADWASKQGLGGLTLPDAAKRAILADLSAWAAGAFQDVDAPLPWEERLVCSGARLAGAPT